jgi:hypothetical protein
MLQEAVKKTIEQATAEKEKAAAERERLAELLADVDEVIERKAVELEQLREIDRLAQDLNGGGSVGNAAAAPRKTSARRSPAPPREKPGTVNRAQAPAGGERRAATGGDKAVPVDVLVESAQQVLANSDRPLSYQAIARYLGVSGDVRTGSGGNLKRALEQLEQEGRAHRAGKVRGGGDGWAKVETERALPLPPGPASEASNLVDRLVDRIVEQLELDGGRVPRSALRERLDDDVAFEDFNLAIDRALTLKKIEKVSAGGVVGYEVKGGR